MLLYNESIKLFAKTSINDAICLNTLFLSCINNNRQRYHNYMIHVLMLYVIVSLNTNFENIKN